MGKTTGIVLGVVLLVLGLALGIFGLISFLAAGSIENSQIRGVFITASTGLILIFIGGGFIITGAVIIYLANIGKIFSYVAAEASPGAEKITRAIGKGITSGIKKGLKEK